MLGSLWEVLELWEPSYPMATDMMGGVILVYEFVVIDVHPTRHCKASNDSMFQYSWSAAPVAKIDNKRDVFLLASTWEYDLDRDPFHRLF